VANIVAVPQQTLSDWEHKPKNISNADVGKAYTPPDLRQSIPKSKIRNSAKLTARSYLLTENIKGD
jgi:hypothetical protein